MTSIGEDAFSGCNLLTEIKFKDIASYCQIDGLGQLDKSKIYIGEQKLTEMTNIVIPDGVTSIGNYAFRYCSSLESITIPDSMTSIGDYVFYNCRLLTDITYEGTKAQWNEIRKDSSWNEGAGKYTIHCTDGDI